MWMYSRFMQIHMSFPRRGLLLVPTVVLRYMSVSICTADVADLS